VPPPSPVDQHAAGPREKAEGHERAGRLRQALEEWNIALTIKPDDAAARDGRQKLEAQIERAVAERTRRGREALRRGDSLEARRHFLAVLALDPGNRTAFDLVQNEVKELRFVPHTVRRGETLASIAERYYGDRARSEVIWEVNQLPANPRLSAGMVLKIPEIPGVPFVQPEARAPAPPADGGAKPETGAPEPGRTPAETYEINPLLVEAREAMEKGDFVAALTDVDKVLAGHAQNAEGLELKKAILYGLGKTQLGQRKYDESYRTLTQLARLQPEYQDSGALLRQARERLVQQHYSQGLSLFREEKLEGAIAEWRAVLELEPEHLNAKRNIDQAERLLRSLRERQQPRRP
jgi:tetratricopeptide (TPR) repeat protein